MKRVFLIGGGVESSNYSDFQAYLDSEEFHPFAKKLKNRKDTLGENLGSEYEILFIPMPNKGFAYYPYWKTMFEKAHAYFVEENILVGNSLGWSFLLKYLSESQGTFPISQVHLIAPALFDTPQELMGSFAFDTSLVGFQRYAWRTTVYASLDDPIVLFQDCEHLQKVLPEAKYVIFKDRGHFLENLHFPELVERIYSL